MIAALIFCAMLAWRSDIVKMVCQGGDSTISVMVVLDKASVVDGDNYLHTCRQHQCHKLSRSGRQCKQIHKAVFTARDRQRASIAWARVLSRDVLKTESQEVMSDWYLDRVIACS